MTQANAGAPEILSGLCIGICEQRLGLLIDLVFGLSRQAT